MVDQKKAIKQIFESKNESVSEEQKDKAEAALFDAFRKADNIIGDVYLDPEVSLSDPGNKFAYSIYKDVMSAIEGGFDRLKALQAVRKK